MKKILNILLSIIFITLCSSNLYASVLEQLKFISEKSDIHFYLNINDMLSFLKNKGVNINDLDEISADDSSSDKDKMIKEFGIKLSDLNEILFAGNSESFEKKSGFVIIMAVKEGKGKIPEALKSKPVKIKNLTFYKIEDEENVLFNKIDDFYLLGSRDFIESFVEQKNSKKTNLSQSASEFVKDSAARSLYFKISVSRYMKETMDKNFMQSALLIKGLNENVFIKALLNLQSIDYGIQIKDKLHFDSNMQGINTDDAEKLLMVSHFAIVGSSLAVTFSDMIAARSEDQTLGQVTQNREFISSLQQIFGRITTKQVNNGVSLSFYMTDKETDAFIALVKKEIADEKKARIERKISEKISVISKAINENDINLAENLINQNIDINHHDLDGNTLLSTASLKGNINIVTLLISKGADVNLKNSDGLTPLHCAAKNGSAEVASFLLKKGADVNAKSEDDMTPLHLNSAQGNSSLTKILVNSGADVNALSLNGSAPVHIASAEGFLDVIIILAEKNADFTIEDGNQERGVDIAARNNRSAVVEYFKNKYNLEPAPAADDNYTEDDEGYDDNTPGPDGDEETGDLNK